jgi:hypothetical protein
MAETFNRASNAITTAGVDVYSAPNNAATDRAVVLSIMVANVDGANAADVTCRLKTSAGNDIAGGLIAKTISVPADSTLELVANKLILKNGEKIHLVASADGDLEATVSVLEIS